MAQLGSDATVRAIATKPDLFRVSLIVFLTTAVSSVIFQSTTFALPKMFDERLSGLADDLAALTAGAEGDGDVATVVGALAFVVFAVASMAQLVVGATLDRYGPRNVFSWWLQRCRW